MDNPSRQRVEALMDRFLATLAPDLLAAQKRRVMEQGLGPFPIRLGGRAGTGRGLLFPRAGPVTLIEHDNTQNNANHVHSVWRDLAADFGHDALAEHYRRSPIARSQQAELNEQRPVVGSVVAGGRSTPSSPWAPDPA